VANAELFYRKSKNQQIEIRRLKEVLKNKDEEIDTLHGKLNELESIKDRKALALFIDSNRLNASTPADTVPLPYHTFEYQGFKILVGKNSQSNDKLTMKHSYKEDLWLHAKDVAGSHVIIKYQSGKKFPKDVIERAAELAAYNSKRKTESLCPVIFTPRKYVRKRKGDPAGTVIVEREETVIVQPRLEPPQW
jgi:predicted ribosome quality control (RQC) complex YloA/Tae2 family protein